MLLMRVKICGLMRPSDVDFAATQGADAIGFVVGTPISRRNLQLDKAKQLVKRVPIFTASVAVTAAADLKSLQRITKRLRTDALQLHRSNLQIIKAIRKANPELSIITAVPIRNMESISAAESSSKFSDAIMAETPSEVGIGGTGRTHDWTLTSLLRTRIHPHPLILAGGLTSSNVRDAIQLVKPYGVDVSSGVENKAGVKDHRKMKEFIQMAKEAKY